MIKVNIFESEKGWGQKLLETKDVKPEEIEQVYNHILMEMLQ